MKTTSPYHDAEALEARLAARLAAGLSQRAAATPHDITERLRVAREQAVARARDARRATAVQPAAAPALVAGRSRGSLVLGGFGEGPAWWQRLASVLPLAVLVVGLLMIQQRMVTEQVEAAAEIDSVLLADDLPPDAYTDPGFGEYLKTPLP